MLSIQEKLQAYSIPGEGDCRIWTRAKRTSGYGVIQFRGRLFPAHRVAYILAHGEVEDWLDICHTCHNKLCINPAHLVAGTRQQNMNHSRYDGRLGKKLTLRDIQLIKALLKCQKPGIANCHFHGRVGKQFGVSYKTVELIRKGHVAAGVGE